MLGQAEVEVTHKEVTNKAQVPVNRLPLHQAEAAKEEVEGTLAAVDPSLLR